MHFAFTVAAAIGILYAILGYNVARMRGVAKTSLGTGEDPRLLKAIRAHGNLAEWAPIVLLLLYALEELGAGQTEMLVLGLGFLAVRILHAWGVLTEDKRPTPFRAIGALGTLLILLWASVHTILLTHGMG